MHKRQSEVWQYANFVESVLDGCSQYYHPNVDFRAAWPPDPVEAQLYSPSALDTVRIANPRGRGPYNDTCDACARK